MVKYVFAFLLALLPVSAAFGDINQDIRRCNMAPNPDLRIGACTRLIQSGQLNDLLRLPGAFVARGIAYAHKGQYDRAIKDFDQANEENWHYVNAIYNRGLVFHKMREYDRAIEQYTAAIWVIERTLFSTFNGNIDAKTKKQWKSSYFFNRGLAHAAKRQYDDAIKDYGEAIRLRPSHPSAYNNRGNGFGIKGQHDRAIEDFNQAIRLKPRNTIAYFNRGNTFYYKAQYDRAIEDYSQTLRLNPHHASARYNRGTAYSFKGQHQLAIKDFNDVIRAKPRYGNAFANRGYAYEKLGNNEQAKKDYEKAITLGVRNPRLLKKLGR